MTGSALRKLTIEHLRGATKAFSLDFEKGKKLTVVYGENGSGKSTICDALDFLGNGSVGSLDSRGLGNTDRYRHSIGRTPDDVSVTLTCDQVCRATISKKTVVAVPPDARPRVEVLRRKQVVDLLEATPGERYKEIERFIDVSGVETSESALRVSIRDMSGARETAVARVQENENALVTYWEAAGKPAPGALQWAQVEVTRPKKALGDVVRAIDAIILAFDKVARGPSRLEEGERGVRDARTRRDEQQARARDVETQLSQYAGETLAVLQSAQAFLERHPEPAECPLCESAEKTAGLRERIAQRLQTLATMQGAQGTLRGYEQDLAAAQQRLAAVVEFVKEDIAEFERCRSNALLPPGVPLPASSATCDSPTLAMWVAETTGLRSAWEQARNECSDLEQFDKVLRNAFDTWNANVAAQKRLDAILPRLEAALRVIADERRKFTDEVLSRIANEVGRLYELVHPGEGLNKISLELDPKKRASLEIEASFLGGSHPPQAYFSDSHLDTLGLCTFLALAALEGPAETVLVLDDVLASVDEPHVERLIEMLYAEALRFRHCLITTHYRPWKQKLRWGWLQHGQCQFVELNAWTADGGLSTIHTIPDTERLRKLLAETPQDPQLICAKAGVILEAALDFLTIQYECPVPRKLGGLYTLGDLLPAMEKKLRKALRVDVKTGVDAASLPTFASVDLGPMLDELSRIAQTRNVFGCHFNQISFDLLDADAANFGQIVLNLLDALLDVDAGWPRNGKSGTYWANSDQTRRLHPFKRPS